MRRITLAERRWIAIAVFAACGVGLLLSWRSYAAARDEAAIARSGHADTLAQARRLVSLRHERALVGDRPRAEPDLVARLQACLHASGIDPALLTQVSSTEPQAVGPAATTPGGAPPVGSTPALKRQQTTLTIESVRPIDLERFFEAWRASEPLWTVRTVRLQHLAGPSPNPGSGGGGIPGAGDDRFSVVLTIENVFLASPPAPSGARLLPPGVAASPKPVPQEPAK